MFLCDNCAGEHRNFGNKNYFQKEIKPLHFIDRRILKQKLITKEDIRILLKSEGNLGFKKYFLEKMNQESLIGIMK